jgi:trehalose-phosphatase
MIDHALQDAIARIAAAPVLLVACDYDGTIAPIVRHPADARHDERCLDALKALARTESTHPAVVSGRARVDLLHRLGATPNLFLVGGHGAEMPPPCPPPPPVKPEELDRLTNELRDIAAGAGAGGAVIETKPTGVALHYRMVDPSEHARLREKVRTAALRLKCPVVREGSMVIELGLVQTDKGRALRWLTDRVYAHAAIFIGDDITDQDAFAVLRSNDVGVQVGDGHTVAKFRVRDTNEVREVLESIVAARAHRLAARRIVSIDEHALLSDQRTGALIDPAGRVVWMCAPRFDSAPIFAALLDGPNAGSFDVAPADNRPPVSRRYDGDSFTLKTDYGNVTVTDYLDCSAGRPFQRAGRTDLIRCVEGTGRVVLRFAPRLDFGRSPTRLRLAEEGLIAEGTFDPVALRSPGVAWTIQDDGAHQSAVAMCDVTPDRPLCLELRLGAAATRAAAADETSRRVSTQKFWTSWAGALRIPKSLAPAHADLVRRSALVLKSLCYGPTGAICAAATTSLPEQMGGVRNWDYRFCWIRDAAMSAAALVRLGCTGPALRYLDYLAGILEELSGPERLRPLYTVLGSELGQEGDVSGVSGFGDSRPVRVGNGAAHQMQLDVFGVVADLLALLAEAGSPLTPEQWRMLDQMCEAVRLRWKEPDHGIWEIRGPMRHHVHSRTMCWFTLARALEARRVGGEPPGPHVEEDRALADEIRADVLANGYLTRRPAEGGESKKHTTPGEHTTAGIPGEGPAGSTEGSGCFTIAYGEPGVDAACLTVGLTGLVAPDDPRFASTVKAVQAELFENNTVLRYRADDGLPGLEGGFHLCTGWLIESLHLCGRQDEARALLNEYIKQAGPLGLYAEERCTISGRALGNYPQAYSHLALINACLRLASNEPEA